ncbi:MAG: succinyl-CoA---D-citramalate CoA-transferase/CoA:oxalate CoA-transferase [Chloroflexi bacterium]|jgi:crotonobetainyl-CoA:carnitine CoA-transferase CaiB-like acyl-CoA transferase|nr:MAG: succinyl-CoA---D-citramalate CoA-transferase/CoA:oxalate CoA-transferase [Chloroflexota bacterium]
MSSNALGGFRILELSTGVAGPFAGKLFADYGADVVKLEPLSGDEARNLPPFFHDHPHPEKSLSFLYLNTNKRSITLDIRTAQGQQMLTSLAGKFDAIIESYPPGYLDNLGVGYSDLSKVNPNLVMTSITPYGQKGPYRDYPGDDIIYEAMGGIMYISGAHDRAPLKHGHPQSLYIAGITAAYATSSALFARISIAKGQHIDLSMRDVSAAHHHATPTRYSFVGTVERRAPKMEAGSPKGGAHFEGIVPVQDGYVGATFQRGIQRGSYSDYVKLLNREDLDDPDFPPIEFPARIPSDKDELLLSALKDWSKFDYFNKAASESWVAAVVQTSQDLVEGEHLNERGFFSEMDHPVVGKIKIPGEIFRLTGSPWALRRATPLIGQHNKEIYCGEFGICEEELVQLRRQAVI